ncbi:MAG: hypothetical protein ACO3JJ_05450 [Opitutaceae bacterium]
MNSNNRRCYGVMVLPEALVRRMREEWRVVETPVRWDAVAAELRVRLARRGLAWRTERRPLAA